MHARQLPSQLWRSVLDWPRLNAGLPCNATALGLCSTYRAHSQGPLPARANPPQLLPLNTRQQVPLISSTELRRLLDTGGPGLPQAVVVDCRTPEEVGAGRRGCVGGKGWP